MDEFLQTLLTIIGTILASSGFWTFVMLKDSKKKARINMLVGLGHDRIITLGMHYVERKWISQEEYENLHDYLYLPYKELGGNGSAERIMEEVKKLPVRSLSEKSDVL